MFDPNAAGDDPLNQNRNDNAPGKGYFADRQVMGKWLLVLCGLVAFPMCTVWLVMELTSDFESHPLREVSGVRVGSIVIGFDREGTGRTYADDKAFYFEFDRTYKGKITFFRLKEESGHDRLVKASKDLVPITFNYYEADCVATMCKPVRAQAGPHLLFEDQMRKENEWRSALSTWLVSALAPIYVAWRVIRYRRRRDAELAAQR